MDVRDGFILGIYNYCDRWCETCAFTSRCRVFADRLEMEAATDANLKAVVDAPPLPQDVTPQPPRWMQECIEEANEIVREVARNPSLDALLPAMAAEHRFIEERARAYSFGVAGWLQTAEPSPERDYEDPRSVVAQFCAFIPAKVFRALAGWSQWGEDAEDGPADHDGSAKVALLAIDRSRAAWMQIVDRGLGRIEDVAPFVSGLGQLTDDLERVFPGARGFVRPAFDEPEEVAKLT